MKKLCPLMLVNMFCALFFLGGCLSSGVSSETATLLDHDYHHMTDEELVAYDQQLSDKLLELSQESSSRGNLGVGLGFGSWSGSSSYGIHADKRFTRPETSTSFKKLEQRRLEVRKEMRVRKITSEKTKD
jgi:hypothetical protein